MNILEEQCILPEEIVIEIINHLNIKTIAYLYRINKYLYKLCQSPNFWRNCAAGNHNKWYKILLSVAKQGDYLLFEGLWNLTTSINLIQEDKILLSAFEECVRRGYDKLMDWLYDKILRWKNLVDMPIEPKSRLKFSILAINAAKNANVDKYRLLRNNIATHYHTYTDAYYWANINSFLVFYKLPINFCRTISKCLKAGNISLAQELINFYKVDIMNIKYIKILSSNNSLAFKFLRTHISSERLNSDIALFEGRIQKWDIMEEYLQYKVPKNKLFTVISTSLTAFSCHQQIYIDLIKSFEVQSIEMYIYYLKSMEIYGENYMLKLFTEQINKPAAY